MNHCTGRHKPGTRRREQAGRRSDDGYTTIIDAGTPDVRVVSRRSALHQQRSSPIHALISALTPTPSQVYSNDEARMMQTPDDAERAEQHHGSEQQNGAPSATLPPPPPLRQASASAAGAHSFIQALSTTLTTQQPHPRPYQRPSTTHL